MKESKWIRSLRAQVEKHNASGADIWTDVDVTLCLGDARRLLYVLDVARGVQEPANCPANKTRTLDEIAGEEAYLLATGAMEG